MTEIKTRVPLPSTRPDVSQKGWRKAESRSINIFTTTCGRSSGREELYCARGEVENRIKEQYSMFANRVSAETMRADQMRIYFSAMAYVLVCGLRRLGL